MGSRAAVADFCFNSADFCWRIEEEEEEEESESSEVGFEESCSRSRGCWVERERVWVGRWAQAAWPSKNEWAPRREWKAGEDWKKRDDL